MSIRLCITTVAVLMVTSGCAGATTPDTSTPPAATAAVADAGAVIAAPTELQAGEALYIANCQTCHGPAGLGSQQGPPFVHPVYLVGHHGDDAFVNAALNGAIAHHWRFGDMPPVAGVTEADVRQIVGYVRWLQQQSAPPSN